MEKVVLDRDGSVPLYVQLENLIRKKIETGEWPVGKMMPSENKIGQACGVSRMTIRNVITKLEQEGLVERVMGKGTFVASPRMKGTNTKVFSIIEQLQEMGYSIRTKRLGLEKKTSVTLAKEFKLPEDTLFYEVTRMRYMNGVPMSVHITYFPVALAPDLENADLEHRQLFKILENDYHVAKGKVSEVWMAGRAPQHVCEILKISTTYPVLIGISTTYRVGNERILFYEKQYFCGEKIKLQLEID